MRVSYILFATLLACSKDAAKKDVVPADTATAAVVASAVPSANGSGHGEHLPPLSLRDIRIPKAASKIHVQWSLSQGTAVNAEAPVKIRFKTSEGLSEVPPDQKTTGATVQAGFDVELKPESHATEAKLVGDVGLVICDAVDHSICLPVKRTLELNFVVGPDAATTQTVSLPLPNVKSRTP